MRHLVDSNRLGRTTSHRKAMLRNMVTSLILSERVETTLVKAKEARRVAERMVTLAKRGTLHARRRASRMVRNPAAVQKLFTAFAKRFQNRSGGYTRIYRLGRRIGDGAPMAILEYLDAPRKEARRRKKSAEEKKVAKAAAKEKPEKKKKKDVKKDAKADEVKEIAAEETEKRKIEREKALLKTEDRQPRKKGFLSRIGVKRKAPAMSGKAVRSKEK